jgi:glycosyltransferase involved in cell wall biosynthesis
VHYGLYPSCCSRRYCTRDFDNDGRLVNIWASSVEDNIEARPLVSIIINNYNYARFLDEAISSALNQTYPHVEVIVVDDGSTDDSRQLIANYEDHIVSVLKENRGMSSACNAGFAASRGEIVVFLDADDYLFPCAVERVVAVWEPGVVKVQYRLEEVDALGRPLGELYPPRHKSLDSGMVWPILLKKGHYVTPVTSGNAFCREVLDRVLPVPEAEFRNSADSYLVNVVPFYGRVGSIEEGLGAYRIHGSNDWSLTALCGERFHHYVRIYLQIHALIIRKADELGYRVPPDLHLRDHPSLSTRIVSLRLDPQKHPILSDHSLRLVYWGLRSTWQYSEFNWKQRLLLSLWFVWVGLLPLPLARPAIALMFLPRSRPGAVEWIIERFVRR